MKGTSRNLKSIDVVLNVNPHSKKKEDPSDTKVWPSESTPTPARCKQGKVRRNGTHGPWFVTGGALDDEEDDEDVDDDGDDAEACGALVLL